MPDASISMLPGAVSARHRMYIADSSQPSDTSQRRGSISPDAFLMPWWRHGSEKRSAPSHSPSELVPSMTGAFTSRGISNAASADSGAHAAETTTARKVFAFINCQSSASTRRRTSLSMKNPELKSSLSNGSTTLTETQYSYQFGFVFAPSLVV